MNDTKALVSKLREESFQLTDKAADRQQREGMVLVPIEPTNEMIEAGGQALGNHIKERITRGTLTGLRQTERGYEIPWRKKMLLRYKAMIAAAQVKEPK